MSCTGRITLKNVLDLSVLHSYLHQINNKTLTRSNQGLSHIECISNDDFLPKIAMRKARIRTDVLFRSHTSMV